MLDPATKASNEPITTARTDSCPSATSSGISEAASISSLRSCTLSRANRTPRSATNTRPNARLKPRSSQDGHGRSSSEHPVADHAAVLHMSSPASPLPGEARYPRQIARVTATWLAISRASVLATDSMLTRADIVGTDSRSLRAVGIPIKRTFRDDSPIRFENVFRTGRLVMP